MAMGSSDPSPALEATAGGVTLRVKVVPGASRSRVAGVLGDRLKVTVAAPPEAGKANAALCDLLARTFSVPRNHVTVTAGTTQPRKTVEVAGLSLCAAAEALGKVLTR